MKKLIVLAVVAMVFGMVSGAFADADRWVAQFRVDDGAGGFSGGNLTVGTSTSAIDGVTKPDTQDVASTGGQTNSIMLTSWTAGTGNGFGYSTDRQAPIPVGTIKTWSLKLWLRDDCNATTIRMTGWNPTGSTGDMPGAPFSAKISVVGDATKTYTWDGLTNGTSAQPQFTWTFTNAQQYKGLENAVELTFEAGYVPEPGSIVAMLSGLVGLGGYAIRRRK